MRFGRSSIGAAASLTMTGVLVLTQPAIAQTSSKTSKSSEGSKKTIAKDRASGVILKVETLKSDATSSKKSKASPATHRLTINTDAVWRDWARDQSQVKDTNSPRKDAAKGRDSVATTGEPVDPNSTVVVDIDPETRIETRFRSPEDETSTGAKKPENAGTGDKASKSEKTVRFRADDLKAGLFIETDYRHQAAGNSATILSVIRPIGGPDSGSADHSK